MTIYLRYIFFVEAGGSTMGNDNQGIDFEIGMCFIFMNCDLYY